MRTPLPCRPIGRTGVATTELGLGAAPLGGLYAPLTDEDARAILRTAIDGGMRYIDTAPYYGFGLSEQRVGTVLALEEGVVISTKVGRLLRPLNITPVQPRNGFYSPLPFEPHFDYTYDGIMRSWEASLLRLDVARIDILYVHDIGRLTHGAANDTYFQQLTAGGGFRALQSLRNTGSIRAFGLGVNEPEVCLEVLQETDLDVILLAGCYTLLQQPALDRLLPECLRRGTSLVIGGPYNSGILASGVISPAAPVRYNYEAAPAEIIERVRRIELIAREYDVPLPGAALQFPLAHPAVISVIPGVDSPERVEQTLQWYGTSIPPEFWEDLRRQGLLRADAPVPAS